MQDGFKDITFEAFETFQSQSKESDFWMVDVRQEKAYTKGHLPGARRIPLNMSFRTSLWERVSFLMPQRNSFISPFFPLSRKKNPPLETLAKAEITNARTIYSYWK